MLLFATLTGFVLCFYLTHKWPAWALILAPVLSILTTFMGVVEEDMVVTCLAPGIFLTTYTLLAFCLKERANCHAVSYVARWLLFAPLCVGIIVFLSVVVDPWAMATLFVFGIWMATMISYGATSRWSKSVCVLSTLGASVRQNLPLPMALDTAAHGRNDAVGRTLLQIKQWLLQGYSVTDALIRGYPQCPRHAWRLLKAAEQVDQLDQGFAAVLQNIEARQKQKESLSPVHPLYPLIILIAVMSVSLGMLKFVMPSYKAVLQEMTGNRLPYITELFITIYTDWGELVFSLILTGIILFLLIRLFRWFRPEAYQQDGFLIRFGNWIKWHLPIPHWFERNHALIQLTNTLIRVFRWFRPEAYQQDGFLIRFGDWIKWHLPILHWFERNYALIQLTNTLRFTCQAGCPVDQCIRNCLGLDMNNCFRRRVKGWLKRVESGQDIAQAARASSLGSTLAWAFDPKVNSGNTLNVLTMLETFYRDNYSYCVNLARIVLTPTITIVLAAFVGFVVIAMFLPAVSIISALTPVYP